MLQATRAAIEERRPLVEKSLDTGRLYIRSDDDDTRAADSGDGARSDAFILIT